MFVPAGWLSRFESRFVRKDGALRWLQWNMRALPDRGLLYAAARDVTDTRKLVDEQAALRAVVDLGTDERMPERIEVTAFYVATEALTNAAKHSDASMLRVCVEKIDGNLRLSISDDGVGGADPAAGSGLVGLNDRVEAAGGALTVRSHPGQSKVPAIVPRSVGSRRANRRARNPPPRPPETRTRIAPAQPPANTAVLRHPKGTNEPTRLGSATQALRPSPVGRLEDPERVSAGELVRGSQQRTAGPPRSDTRRRGACGYLATRACGASSRCGSAATARRARGPVPRPVGAGTHACVGDPGRAGVRRAGETRSA